MARKRNKLRLGTTKAMAKELALMVASKHVQDGVRKVVDGLEAFYYGKDGDIRSRAARVK